FAGLTSEGVVASDAFATSVPLAVTFVETRTVATSGPERKSRSQVSVVVSVQPEQRSADDEMSETCAGSVIVALTSLGPPAALLAVRTYDRMSPIAGGAVGVEPTCAVPVIVGGARLLCGPLTSFVAELADAEPLPFVPVTATTSL